jgi:hypothetical protein
MVVAPDSKHDDCKAAAKGYSQHKGHENSPPPKPTTVSAWAFQLAKKLRGVFFECLPKHARPDQQPHNARDY